MVAITYNITPGGQPSNNGPWSKVQQSLLFAWITGGEHIYRDQLDNLMLWWPYWCPDQGEHNYDIMCLVANFENQNWNSVAIMVPE